MSAVRDLQIVIEKFENFLSAYFGVIYDEGLWEKWEPILIEMRLYIQNEKVGGWSSAYCSETWNKADLSKIFFYLCYDGAFEIIKVHIL